MYTADHAEVYDLVYRGRGKDYAAEVSQVMDLAERRGILPSSLLDVACGTGAHLEHFADLVDRAEGVELSEEMIGLARRRVPSARLHTGDMRDFSLGTTFSLVTCMFSSIGYMRDTIELGLALSCLARHLEPGGVVVVEPWWFPETFIEGYVSAHVVEEGRRSVSRVSHSVREGGDTVMEVHFVVADAGLGVRHFVDVHRIALFTREEYETAFRDAGLKVEFIEGGPSGRGLLVGTSPV